MKNKAFTLIELLVVVSILGLLVAMLLPSLGQAQKLARCAVCQHNLKQLGSAFHASCDQRSARSGMAVSLFPVGGGWPAVPMDVVPDNRIYKCPEDDVISGDTGCLPKLSYHAPGGFDIDLSGPNNSGMWFMSRTGQDENGAYIDYILEDDGSTGGLSFHGWTDTDGTMRIWPSTGYVWIYDTLPDTPEWSGAYPSSPGNRAGANNCRDGNFIYYNGKPAFGADGSLNTYRGQKFWLDGWATNTNYGINDQAVASRQPRTIALLDYKRLIAEPLKGPETSQLLLQSARHRGRVNVLLNDMSVSLKTPMEVSPEVDLTWWLP